MAFTTNIFIFYFLPIVVFIYFLIHKFAAKFENVFLLFSSLLFCLWASRETLIYVVLLTIILYLYSLLDKNKYYKIFLIILILGFSIYKILSFCSFDHNLLNKLISLEPIAFSFVSLSAISFCIDSYKYDIKTSNVLDIALYISFFPKFMSGPIVLWKSFNKQIYKREVSIHSLVQGIIKFIQGFACKIIIANSLSESINPIISNYKDYNSLALLLCIFTYSFIIYFDFMGYSKMAIGISEMFGFSIDKNFDLPYMSHSLNEFYRKWHISLGTFLKEYVYIPLGGNRSNVYINIMIVMIISGIWHGNNISYVIWGILNGLIMILERKFLKNETILFVVLNFVLVSVLWMPFMLNSTGNIIEYISCIFSNAAVKSTYDISFYFNVRTIIILIVAIIFSFIDIDKMIRIKHPISFYLLYTLIFILSLMFMINSTYTPFIYFRF